MVGDSELLYGLVSLVLSQMPASVDFLGMNVPQLFLGKAFLFTD